MTCFASKAFISLSWHFYFKGAHWLKLALLCQRRSLAQSDTCASNALIDQSWRFLCQRRSIVKSDTFVLSQALVDTFVSKAFIGSSCHFDLHQRRSLAQVTLLRQRRPMAKCDTFALSNALQRLLKRTVLFQRNSLDKPDTFVEDVHWLKLILSYQRRSLTIQLAFCIKDVHKIMRKPKCVWGPLPLMSS